MSGAISMRLSVIQMNSGHDKAQNIAQAERLVSAALAAERPAMIALPEMWTCLGGDRATKQLEAEILPQANTHQFGGSAYEFLRGVARAHRVHVHGGSMAEFADGQLFNTTVVFDPSGLEIARYRKIHLFDISTPDGAGYRESAIFGSGTNIVTYEADGLRVGCAICYDLRFPELFQALRKAGADLIFLPSAFTLATGRDHWEVLLRARAIETQCWFAAPAMWGEHLEGASGGRRQTYGHSLICNPWGHVVARASDGIGWATATVDTALTSKIRRDMPVIEHRRIA
jgi:predicted amidohydrolase